MNIKISYVDKGPCDKCDKDVKPANSALYWSLAYDALKRGADPAIALKSFADNPTHSLVYTQRHLEAVEGCEGSPSRRSMALEGMVSSANDSRLPREKWTPLSETEAASAKKAYELIGTIVE